jgi:hypothetical protein
MDLGEGSSEKELLLHQINEESLVEEENWCCFRIKPKLRFRFPVYIDLVTDHTRSRLVLSLLVGFLVLSFFSLFFVTAFDILTTILQVKVILRKIFDLNEAGKPPANQTMAFNLVQNLLNINFGIICVFIMSIFSIPILFGVSVWQSTKYRLLASIAIIWFAGMFPLHSASHSHS